jgi:hypothetical protein
MMIKLLYLLENSAFLLPQSVRAQITNIFLDSSIRPKFEYLITSPFSYIRRRLYALHSGINILLHKFISPGI